ncbi:hypothetical protein MCM1_3519 [Methanosarcina barkeri CM1]|uniref:Uncharacterized protein n=1 Tax=Methanosarcina barkeri CM1 TaxID=796385 RepID=A0A0G3CN04_METBA|nr:hypothetical protein MCM1_3519 [Methanosarcina barkeri CM1]
MSEVTYKFQVIFGTEKNKLEENAPEENTLKDNSVQKNTIEEVSYYLQKEKIK